MTRFRPTWLLALLATSSLAAESPSLAGCPVLPADNIWNTAVDRLPVDPQSQAYVATIGANSPAHADFGAGLLQGAPIGIPFITVSQTQAKVGVTFEYADESDSGPYPIPPDAPIEGGAASNGDRHVLIVDRDRCILYEVYSSYPVAGGASWRAGSGAIFDLRSNTLRPANWTSADAAGLPILPGLARYGEVAAGEIRHALRFTVPRTRRAWVWPARHFASSLTGPDYPPMGQRFRLKADFDISGFPKQSQVILTALKKYGMILADNGSSWFISGAPDDGWDNNDLGTLRRVHGSDFEAVDSTTLMAAENSGKSKARIHAAVNAASFAGAAFAPGELVSIFGINLAAPVLVDGAPVPALLVTPDQINARLPAALAPGTSQLQTGDSDPYPLPIVRSAPGLFPVIWNENGFINSSASPAPPGSVIQLFATGGPLESVTANVGEVASMDQSPGLVRLSVRLGGAGGLLPLVVTFGGVPTQPGLTVAVK